METPVEPSSIRCVVVEDHVMVLQMLCGVLRTLDGITVVATGTALSDTRRLASTAAIDLLILDPALGEGDGFELLRSLAQAHPNLKCVVITSSDATAQCPADLIDHVVAVVDKVEPWETLLAAIDQASGDGLKARLCVPNKDKLLTMLTDREFDVFESLGRGRTNKEIAKHLGISVRTVETHRKAVSRKLGYSGASLVRLATLSQHLSLP